MDVEKAEDEAEHVVVENAVCSDTPCLSLPLWSDCDTSGLLDEVSCEPGRRESSVNSLEWFNLTDDPTERTVHGVNCLGSVSGEGDAKHRRRPEAIVSVTTLKNKAKRNRHLKPKRGKRCFVETQRKSENVKDDDRQKTRGIPLSYQEEEEELSTCQEEGDGTEQKKKRLVTRMNKPSGVRRSRKKHSSSAPYPRKLTTDTQSRRCSEMDAQTPDASLSRKPARKIKDAQQQPVQLMCPPQESMIRRDKAMALVLDSLETLGRELEAEEGGKGLFIISCLNYDNYLSRIPTYVLCGESDRGGHLGASRDCRGVLDILILQEHVGTVLVQVRGGVCVLGEGRGGVGVCVCLGGGARVWVGVCVCV